MATTVIKSNDIIDIENNFIVKAGPGAGKTYWLELHINHVLSTSKRLGKIKRIACITYTNIGVETIKKRLKGSVDRVDVCTIHSFLYENIIKPYFHFIANEYSFALDKLKVIDDTVMCDYGTLYKLKNNIHKVHVYKDDQSLREALFASRWTFDGKDLKFKPSYPRNSSGYTINQVFYDEYKKYAWGKGVMHYDDILFFSYKLMLKYPFIAEVISAKYPYVFIDEFQDSTPIQVKIIKQIAATSNSIIGVIGDKAQSIYGFAGTDSNLFDNFTLEGILTYEIKGNRRSTEEIITLLNAVRTDLQQIPVESRHIEKPILYVGDVVNCYNKFKSHCDSNLVTLSYANLTSNALMKQLGQIPPDENLFKTVPDSNWKRVECFKNCIKSIEYALVGAIKDALKVLKKAEDDEHNQLRIISKLLADYDEYKNGSALQFMSYLKKDIGVDIARLNRGPVKDFYSNKSYLDFALYVSPPDISSLQNKTIHKTKGDEFDNVMLVLQKEEDLKFFTEPHLDEKSDGHRVYYVAISRAKDRLAICVPSLSQEMRDACSRLPIKIEIL